MEVADGLLESTACHPLPTANNTLFSVVYFLIPDLFSHFAGYPVTEAVFFALPYIRQQS